MLVKLTVVNDACIDDEISTNFNADPVKYDIGQTGPVQINPTWNENTKPECPFTFELLKVVGGSE
jgi:hypothetical protein